MFSNTTPLNWYNTLRRLKKEGDFNGHLGKELGLLPGRKAFTSQLMGATKHKPTHILTEAATPATKHIKAHKPRKNVKALMAQYGASEGDTLNSPSVPDSAPAATPAVESVHRQVQNPPIIRLESELNSAATKIATKIQAIKRGNDVRRKLAKEQQAATKIQALGRGFNVRRSLTAKAPEGGSTPSQRPTIHAAKAPTEGSTPSQRPTIHAATAALLSPESPSKAAPRMTPVKPDSQITSEPAYLLPNIRPHQSLLPRRAGKKANSVKKVGIEKGKAIAGTLRALYRKKKEESAPQNIIQPLKNVKQRKPRRTQNKRTAPLEHKGKYDNPQDAKLIHKYPFNKLRKEQKKEKKTVKQRLLEGGLAQGLLDAGKGLLQMAGIGSRDPVAKSSPAEPTPSTQQGFHTYNTFRTANGGKKWGRKKMSEEWGTYKQSHGIQ
jgi:hypothetical protein